MKTFPLVALGLGLLVSPCRAQWGWPPPGYSVQDLRAPDGSQWRGLCKILSDRGWFGRLHKRGVHGQEPQSIESTTAPAATEGGPGPTLSPENHSASAKRKLEE
jgi:hypothetical protein